MLPYSSQELKQWWPARCPQCRWQGLSRDCEGGRSIADTGDYSEVLCPDCFKNDAICVEVEEAWERVLVWTDGSCETLGQRTGSAAAIMQFEDEHREVTIMATAATTINQMELTAFIQAMQHIYVRFGALRSSLTFLEFVTDSKITMLGIMGNEDRGTSPQESRDANPNLWQLFDLHRGLFSKVRAIHESRDTIREQRAADALCHHVRGLMKSIVEHDDFPALKITRKTKFL